MKRRSLHGLATQVDKATHAAMQSSTKLLDLVDDLSGELKFRSSVTGVLEQYRQELMDGKTRYSLKDVLDRVEAFFILQTMREVNDNIAQAAELLRIPEATLRYKLGKHGMR